MKTIIEAFRKTFERKKYYLLWFLLAFGFFWIFIFVPTFTIPENSIILQLTLLTSRDFLIQIVLSILITLMITIQVFAFRVTQKKKHKLGLVGSGGISSYLAFFGVMLATPVCASCLLTVFGYLGAGTVLFGLQHSNGILAASIALIAVSIYITSRKIIKGCEACNL